MTRPQAEATPLLKTDRATVTRFDFAPGAETGWHVHAHDYVIVALTDLELLVETPGGQSTRSRIEAGASYGREQGVDHNVINAGVAPMAFVEIELTEPRR